jgi:Ca2+-binding EF-hand superfamily protein
VIATSLPPEEIEGIRRMFMEMDHDGSGTISFEELREGAGAAPPTAAAGRGSLNAQGLGP